MTNQVLKKLSDKRKLWVQSTRDNNFENGIYKLLTKLYPDNAHFIFELLQNAEDAEASEVFFELTENRLTFKHNGRLFNKEDVEGITSIGEGTKVDDINKIGEFGVGFKAVFSYTDRPKIYSGKYNFEIIDLVVPHEIDPILKKDNETVILFPFNNPDKLPFKAFGEIKKGLLELHNSTLLFLSNISTINYRIENKSFSIKRQNTDDIQLSILNTKSNTQTKWLRFKKHLPNSDKLFVSIAFLIDYDKKNKKKIIKPVTGKISIYFPAEKETSNLRFHIHAPFASTVARDSIKDIDDNNKLRDLLAELLCSSLDYIKEKGFLDFNFLTCLPIEEDNLSEFYKPIQKKLVEFFNNGNYLLTDQGDYRRPIKCYKSTAAIKKIISKDDLKTILDIKKGKHVYWLKNPSQINSREDKFLQSLDIQSFNYSDLLDALQSMIDEFDYTYDKDEIINKYRLKTFLKNKSNEWLKKFYELLYDIISNDKYSDFYDYSDFKIFIKLQNGQFNYSFSNCYFESKTNLKNTHLCVVNKETYNHDFDEKKQKSKSFLEELGVKNIELRDEVEIILKEYNNEIQITLEDHLYHMELFLDFFEETKNTEIFREHKILINNKNNFVIPDKILVDYPWEETNLKLIDGTGGRYLLNNCYEKINNKSVFIDFLKSIDAHFSLPIEKQTISFSHPNYYELIEEGYTSEYTIDFDFTFHKKKRLGKKDIKFSLLVWNSLSKHEFIDGNYEKDIFTARFRRIKSSRINIAPSTLLLALKEYAWIPDNNGNFHKPSDISAGELHNDFKYSNENGWLDKIEFGNKISYNQEEYKKRRIALELSGFTLEELAFIKNNKVPFEKIKEFVENEKAKSFDLDSKRPNFINAIKKHSKEIEIIPNEDITPGIIKNEEEYREKAQKNLALNIEKSGKLFKHHKSRQKIKVGKTETIEFLKQQYRGHCQICGFTFNQKGDKGNYFEVFDWLSEKITGQKTNIIDAGSSLSLCSRCHSAIKYGDFDASVINEISNIGDLNELNFSEFTDLINSSIETDDVPNVYSFIELDMYKIPIRLLNEKQNIFYTEEHFMHFFNLLTLELDKQEVSPKEIEQIPNDYTNPDSVDLNNKSNNQPIQQVGKLKNNGLITEYSNNEIRNGSKVKIKYLKTNKVVKIKIVQQRINKRYKIGEYLELDNNSPLAQALIGHCTGEVVKMGEKTEILIEDIFNN